MDGFTAQNAVQSPVFEPLKKTGQREKTGQDPSFLDQGLRVGTDTCKNCVNCLKID